MKLKEIDRTATTCWAPFTFSHNQSMCPLIACGSVSGAMDASFSASAELELFAIDLNSPGSLKEGILKLGSAAVTSRFSKLGWSPFGAGSQECPYGMIAAGMEDGTLDLWNTESLLHPNASGEQPQGPMFSNSTHTGALKALEFNPFQSNLVATGAANAELFIWDLTNFEKPFTPGVKSQRLQDVTALAWNRQVSHILATASNNGCAVIWDLKNRREVIHLASPNSRKPITAIAWNPDIATQILTASDDDEHPVIYMWDLRNAHAPEKILTGHTKGLLSLAWSSKDSDLLLSCGKDHRTLCWNPSSGEVIGEFPPSTNWAFEVQWCPKNPDLLSTASFDGKVSIYSIQAKSTVDPTHSLSPQSPHDPFHAALHSNITKQPTFTLKHPPKWMRRPVGAIFGFGNKLVSFAKSQPGYKIVIRSVFPDPEIGQRAQRLQVAMDTGDFVSLSEERILQSQSQGLVEEEMTWRFLHCILQPDARIRIQRLLGCVKNEGEQGLSEQLAKLKLKPLPELLNGPKEEYGEEPLDGVSKYETKTGSPFSLFQNNNRNDLDAALVNCVLTADFERAVHLCLCANRVDDAVVLASCGGPELLTQTRSKYFSMKRHLSYVRLMQAVMDGKVSEVISNVNVEQDWKEVLSFLCTYASTEEFNGLVGQLAERLSSRNGAGGKGLGDSTTSLTTKTDLHHASLLAYIAAGDVEHVLVMWNEQLEQQLKLNQNQKSERALQTLMEKISTLRHATGHSADFAQFDPPSEESEDALQAFKNEKRLLLQRHYVMYAYLLSRHGRLQSALTFLHLAKDVQTDLKKEFVYRVHSGLSSSEKTGFGELPAFPFEYVDVKSTVVLAEPDEWTKQMGSGKTKSPSKSPAKTGYVPNNPTVPNPYGQPPVQKQNPYGQPPAPNQNPYAQPPAQTAYGQNQNPYAQPAAQNPYGQPPVQNQNPYAQPAAQNPYGQPPVQNQNPYAQQQPYNPYAGYSQPASAAPPAPPPTGRSFVPTPQPIVNGQQDATPPLSPSTQGMAQVPASQRRSVGGFNDPPSDIFKEKKKKQPVAPMAPNSAFPQTVAQNPYASNPVPQNPYATPMAVGPAQPPPPQGPMAPKPQQQPMQPIQPMYNQPGSGSPVPIAQAVQPIQAAIPDKVKHAVGDRSHILGEHKPVFEVLSRLLNGCKPNATPVQKKTLDDAEKRLNLLFDKLNNQDLGEAALTLLLQLVQAVEARDWAKAAGHQQALMSNHSNEGTNWMLGIRRLLDTAKALQA